MDPLVLALLEVLCLFVGGIGLIVLVARLTADRRMRAYARPRKQTGRERRLAEAADAESARRAALAPRSPRAVHPGLRDGRRHRSRG